VKARPFGRPLELANVPGPDLPRPDGQQLRLGVRRMGPLFAPRKKTLNVEASASGNIDLSKIYNGPGKQRVLIFKSLRNAVRI